MYKRGELTGENLSNAYPQTGPPQQGSEPAPTTTVVSFQDQGVSAAASDPNYQMHATLQVARTGDVFIPPSQEANDFHNPGGAPGIQGPGTNNGQQLPNVVLTSLPVDAVQQFGVMPMPPPSPVLYLPPPPPAYQLPATPAPQTAQSAATYIQSQTSSNPHPPPSYDDATA